MTSSVEGRCMIAICKMIISSERGRADNKRREKMEMVWEQVCVIVSVILSKQEPNLSIEPFYRTFLHSLRLGM